MKKTFSFLLAATLILCNTMKSTGESAETEDAQQSPDAGVALIYDTEDTGGRTDIHVFVEALRSRVDALGMKRVRIKPYGDDGVHIIAPDLSVVQLAQLKAAIERPGKLSFRILANKIDHTDLIKSAKGQPDVDRWVLDDAKSRIGLWADVACFDAIHGGELRVDVSRAVFRDTKTKALLTPPAEVRDQESLTKWLREKGCANSNGTPQIQVLTWTADGYNVEGRHFSKVEKAVDERGNLSLHFAMTKHGAKLMSGLTGDHLPDKSGHSRRLGVLLDDELITAPTIRGQITAEGELTGHFTREEVDFILNILRTGKLPALLKSPPVSEIRFAPRDTSVQRP